MLSDFVYDNGRENALARFSGIRARFRRRAAMESRSCLRRHSMRLKRSSTTNAGGADENYSIANALETMATGLLSVALDSVTRPKLMVRPRRTTRASASTSEEVTARMKWVV